ncbi:MAG TPA: rRNA pseudouridine synthase [Candidatus Coproplasma stercoravium]|nr:rRNA pseudouridine synthase [Candidatus Coproplasma stercoravium]
MRINKYLAQCGVASRRDCDKLVADGRVTVNGRPADVGADVEEGDVIKVDGKVVTLKKNEYYILHKPKGYLCTVSDDKGRKTVMDILGSSVGRVYPVGRLDYDSEGLLILTTDGELAQHLTHPSNEVPKTYVVKVEGRLTEADLNPIRSGIEIEGGYVTKKCRAHIIETNRDFTRVEITLREGKNREIRKMFAAIGKEVTLLKRTKVGELSLRGLDRGAFRKLSPAEVAYLKSI